MEKRTKKRNLSQKTTEQKKKQTEPKLTYSPPQDARSASLRRG